MSYDDYFAENHMLSSKPINVDEVNLVNEDDGRRATTPLKLDVQEFVGLSEDEVVDYETAEEFLLHFSRIGQVHFVLKLLRLRDTKEISLNVNCRGESKANFGWTPLHLAAYFGHDDVIEVLLKHGANVDAQNEQGDTPLHKAAYTGRDPIVIRLISNNANVFILNGDGLRPFELAKSEPIRQILSAAEKADIKRREEKFLSAARNGDLAAMKVLIEDATNPVDINCVDSSGNTALHCAAYRGQNQAVIFLLKNNIDTTVKNKRNQLASNVATTISLKQIIQEVHLSAVTPQTIASLKNRAVSRFEGLLLKKGRFFGWKVIWAVLERGVFSFFDNRANAAAGVRRKGYKYLEGAITETINSDESNQYVFQFLIIFGDRSRALFSLPKTQTELDLQKWLNAINDHIYFGTNFIKQGTRIDDSDDEDEAAKLLPLSSVQDMISTAAAHQKILEKHISGLQQLFDDGAFLNNNCNEAMSDVNSNRTNSPGSDCQQHYNRSSSSTSIPSINFHLELILESSRNANTSLAQCLSVMSHQNEARQAVIRQEQDKVRVLEEALHSLAREHHDLERSISMQNCASQSQNLNGNSMSMMDSIHHSNSHAAMLSHLSSRVRSITCLSQTTATDLDEYFDAFDDDELFGDNLSERTLTTAGDIDNHQDPKNGSNVCGQLLQSNDSNLIDGISFAKGQNCASLTSFHTAQPQPFSAAPDETTINDSISPLTPDDDDCEDQTLADEIEFCRDRLAAPMVPHDEIGLWSILKHCIGKDLSRITFPVIFNEPLSFLQRLTEMFQYCHFLNIADQCDDIVERMENVCAFIVACYSSNHLRLTKPFNPLLGETFEFEIASAQTRIVFEQVSHHPPISAWHAESPHFVLHGTANPKLKFWGKSVEIKSEGLMTLRLKDTGDVYTWKTVNCCIHNIIVGKLWYEQYGTIEVKNRVNNCRITLNFRPAGWFGSDLNRFDGFISNANNEKLRFVYGKWNDYLKTASVDDYNNYLKTNNQKFRPPDKPLLDDFSAAQSTPRKFLSKLSRSLTSGGNSSNGSIDLDGNYNNVGDNLPPDETANDEIPKSDSSNSLDISNSRILWKATPRPAHSPQYYNFSSFSFGLNELPEDKEVLAKFPMTDSRFRPDIRKLEEGDLDGAAAEKNRLEEKQRETRHMKKKCKDKDWEPLWFRQTKNQYTNELDWLYNQEYEKRNWSRCPDIF